MARDLARERGKLKSDCGRILPLSSEAMMGQAVLDMGSVADTMLLGRITSAGSFICAIGLSSRKKGRGRAAHAAMALALATMKPSPLRMSGSLRDFADSAELVLVRPQKLVKNALSAQKDRKSIEHESWDTGAIKKLARSRCSRVKKRARAYCE